jgi:malonyl-CoA O-methyltransferase
MPFVDMHDFGDMMVASGFATPVMDAEIVTLTYASLRTCCAKYALWAAIRATIARNRCLRDGRRAKCSVHWKRNAGTTGEFD